MIKAKELRQYTQNLTLLFAEDHDDLRASTAEILKSFFKQVDSVENGEKALSLYKSSNKNSCNYDIVLTDIQMPKMDGIALTQSIYAIYPNQTIIVLSAHDESEYLLKLINLGISHFIKKPINYDELLEVLYKITQRKNASNNNSAKSTIELGESYIFNRDTQTLSTPEENIYLTKFEILFLQQLTQEVGKIYSTEDIVSYFTDVNEQIDPHNIRKLVSKLRKKIPVNSLESIYSLGYRLNSFKA